MHRLFRLIIACTAPVKAIIPAADVAHVYVVFKAHNSERSSWWWFMIHDALHSSVAVHDAVHVAVHDAVHNSGGP